MIEAVAIAGLVLAILGLTQARQATTLLRQVQVVCKVQAQKIRTLELRQSESRLNRVWITPEERTKIRGSGEYLTDVLTGLLNRQGAATTPQMEIENNIPKQGMSDDALYVLTHHAEDLSGGKGLEAMHRGRGIAPEVKDMEKRRVKTRPDE